MLKLKYMWKDECTAEISVEGKKVTLINHTDDLIRRPFGINIQPTIYDFEDFLEERAFPQARGNCNQLLEDLSLNRYSPLAICRKTYGRQWDDFHWIQFRDQEAISYNDIKLRPLPIKHSTSNPFHQAGTFFLTSEDEKTFSPSCKGNQTKWQKDNFWLKAEYLGYESLAEYLSTWIAKQTNIGDFAPIVEYRPCDIEIHGQMYRGCYSKNLLHDDEECITFYKMISSLTNGDKFFKRFDKMSTLDRIRSVVEIIQEETHIANLGEWLTCLMEFDSLILNEDRHFNNLAVVRKADGTYRLMDLFDNGAGFCSDTSTDYPLDLPPSICMSKVKAKPFASTFKKQVEAFRSIYGAQLTLKPSLIQNMHRLDRLDELDFTNYTRAEYKRALSILRSQVVSQGASLK